MVRSVNTHMHAYTNTYANTYTYVHICTHTCLQLATYLRAQRCTYNLLQGLGEGLQDYCLEHWRGKDGQRHSALSSLVRHCDVRSVGRRGLQKVPANTWFRHKHGLGFRRWGIQARSKRPLSRFIPLSCRPQQAALLHSLWYQVTTQSTIFKSEIRNSMPWALHSKALNLKPQPWPPQPLNPQNSHEKLLIKKAPPNVTLRNPWDLEPAAKNRNRV